MQTMVDVTRVTADEVKARMDRGERFTFVDARNPGAWAESEVKLPGLDHGFHNVHPLHGGFDAWRGAGYPLDPK